MKQSSFAEILVVDDDARICRLLKHFLEGAGYAVRTASTGEEMRKLIKAASPDLVILDLMLGGEDGFEIARELRSQSDISIIMLSGKSDVFDKVVGLEIGADDYVTKPFNNRELLARVHSVLRRNCKNAPVSPKRDPSIARFAGWTLNMPAYELTSPLGKKTVLTSSEFHLLSALVTHHNRVLPREEILEMIAGREWSPVDRSIDVLVGKLRKKIETDPKSPCLIKTIRGIGYKFAGKVHIS